MAVNDSSLAHPKSLLANEDDIDLGALIATLKASRHLILGCVAGALLIGGTHAFFAQSIYQVDALIQVEDSKGVALSGSVKDLDGLLDTKSLAATETELLRSRLVLGQTVSSLGLDISAQPRLLPKIGPALARRHLQLLPAGMFGYGTGSERIDVARLEVPKAWVGRSLTLTLIGNGKFSVKSPDGNTLGTGFVGKEFMVATVDGFGLFVRELTGAPGTKFDLIRLPRLAAISALNSGFSAYEKGKQSGLLVLSLRSPDPELAVKALNNIATYYVRQNVERKSAEASQTLKYLEESLPETKRELDMAEMRYNTYRSQNNAVDVGKEEDVLLGESVRIESSLVEMQQKKKELLGRFTLQHPAVLTLDSQIALLQQQKDKLSRRVDVLPMTQQEIMRLTRDLKVRQETYSAMLNNAQQLKVVRGGAVGNVRIIDLAEMPLLPVEPRRGFIVVMAMMMGLIFGVVAAFVRQALRRGVKDARLIESQLGYSVFATIPQSGLQDRLQRERAKTDGQARILALLDEQDTAIESLRSLRTTLHFASLDAENNRLLITGPAPQVGKTFIAMNLAAVLTKAGERVLLIDADMRRGKVNESFGYTRDDGLSNVIAGQISLDQAIKKTSLPGLDFISTGTIPPNPSELLLRSEFLALLEEVSGRYDRVVIDGPPIMAVTDAAIIGRHVGTVLLTARFGKTPIAELDISMKRLNNAGVVINGVLLNGVDQFSDYGYSYNYRPRSS